MKASIKQKAQIKARKLVKALNLRNVKLDTIQDFRCAKCGKILSYGSTVLAWNNEYGVVTSCTACMTPGKLVTYFLSRRMSMQELKTVDVRDIIRLINSGGK